MNAQASIDLLDAVAYMKQHGRARIVLEDYDGTVCPLGAIGYVTIEGFAPGFGHNNDNNWYRKLEQTERSMAAIRKLVAHISDPPVHDNDVLRAVFRWNDSQIDNPKTDQQIFEDMEAAARDSA